MKNPQTRRTLAYVRRHFTKHKPGEFLYTQVSSIVLSEMENAGWIVGVANEVTRHDTPTPSGRTFRRGAHVIIVRNPKMEFARRKPGVIVMDGVPLEPTYDHPIFHDRFCWSMWGLAGDAAKRGITLVELLDERSAASATIAPAGQRRAV